MADELIENAEFGRKRKNEEDPILVAQRFLNIYRQMHIFNKQRQEQFDNMLLELPPDIRILLSTLPGGSLLLEHIEELEQTRGLVSMPIKQENNFRKKSAKELLKNDNAAEKSNAKQAAGGGVVIDSSFAAELSTSLSLALQQTEKRYKDDIKTLTETITQSIMESQSAIANMMKDILIATRNNPSYSDNDNASLRVLSQDKAPSRPVYEEKVITPLIQNAVENNEKIEPKKIVDVQTDDNANKAFIESPSQQIMDNAEETKINENKNPTAKIKDLESLFPESVQEENLSLDKTAAADTSARDEETKLPPTEPTSESIEETVNETSATVLPVKTETNADITIPENADNNFAASSEDESDIEQFPESPSETRKSSYNFGRISALSKDLTKRLTKGGKEKKKDYTAEETDVYPAIKETALSKNDIKVNDGITQSDKDTFADDDNGEFSLDSLLNETDNSDLKNDLKSTATNPALLSDSGMAPYQSELNQIRDALNDSSEESSKNSSKKQDRIQPELNEKITKKEHLPKTHTTPAADKKYDFDNLSNQDTPVSSLGLENISLDDFPDEPISLDDIPDEPISLDNFENDFTFSAKSDGSSLSEPVPSNQRTKQPDLQNRPLSNPSTPVNAAAAENDQEWEWEYVDDAGTAVDDNADDWEWEYVEEEGEDDSDDWEWEYVEDDAGGNAEDDSGIKK